MFLYVKGALALDRPLGVLIYEFDKEKISGI